MKLTKIALIGGDQRQIYASRALARMGWEVSVCGLGRCDGEIAPARSVGTLDDAIIDARRILELGEWQNWHRGEKKIGISKWRSEIEKLYPERKAEVK